MVETYISVENPFPQLNHVKEVEGEPYDTVHYTGVAHLNSTPLNRHPNLSPPIAWKPRQMFRFGALRPDAIVD